jgi:Zn-dependent protease with chaperone function
MKFVPRELRDTADASRGDHSWGSFLKNSASVVLILGFLYLLLGLVADVVAWTLPESWEAGYLGPSALGWAVPEVDESEDLARARILLDSLTEGAELRPLPYHLFLIDEPDPNAVALPGGGIGLTRGLLDRVDSDIGLATVLAHELGHHQGRHNLRLLGRAILSRMVIALLFGESGSVMAEVPLFLAESGYSRRQEAEADEFALRLVNDHFGHTRGSLEFFELVRDEFEAGTHQWGTFLSTHPLTVDRIERLHELQREMNLPHGDGDI